MTGAILTMLLVAGPEGGLEHEIDLLGGLIPNHTYASMGSVTVSYALRVSEHLGASAWGGWVGSWDKKLAAELRRVALSQTHTDDLTFPRPEWLAGASVYWRLPYDEAVESRLHVGPMFLSRAEIEGAQRFGVGVLLGGGLRFGLAEGLSGIVDIGGMVFSPAETPIEVRYLLTVRVGLGVTI